MLASSERGRRGIAGREPRNLWVQAESIESIHRVVSNLSRSESFYRSVLDFHAISTGPVDAALLAGLGVADRTATETRMRLGQEDLVLVQFEPGGKEYPAGSRSNDLWFQHIAVVVRDMNQAYSRLRSSSYWQAISTDGPETLPASSGGVSAFKFRDPDGHPLELLWFPPGQGRSLWHERAQSAPSDEPFLGIDHSALAVSSTRRSLAFYHSLGLLVTARSVNSGPAQSRLDGIAAARVRVTGMRPSSDVGPGIELLAYKPPGRPRPASGEIADLATDWTTLTGVMAGRLEKIPTVLTDPDGHRVMLVPHRIGSFGVPA